MRTPQVDEMAKRIREHGMNATFVIDIDKLNSQLHSVRTLKRYSTDFLTFAGTCTYTQI